MTTRPPQVPWPREPHTAAKHEIYRLYLERWFPILIKGRGWDGDVTYAEGFAGPGIYTKGEAGSPVIALRTLFGDPSLRGRVRKARMLFVDADQRCTSRLTSEISARGTNGVPLTVLRDQHGVDVQVKLGPCEPTLEQLLDQTGAWGHPMLVVLDTFGGAVSARLLRRIAENPAGETIVTIQPQHFARFADAPDVTNGDEVFGDTEWRRVAQQPAEHKVSWLLQRYRQTVIAAGFTHVLDFELVDRRGQALYLVFGTSHDRGLQKMKEVIWEVDDVAGVGYRDPRDPDQETLAIELEPQTAPLRRLLRDFLAVQPGRRATVHGLRRFALYRTIYKESQVKPMVQQMVDANELLSSDAPLRFSSEVRAVQP